MTQLVFFSVPAKNWPEYFEILSNRYKKKSFTNFSFSVGFRIKWVVYESEEDKTPYKKFIIHYIVGAIVPKLELSEIKNLIANIDNINIIAPYHSLQ